MDSLTDLGAGPVKDKSIYTAWFTETSTLFILTRIKSIHASTLSAQMYFNESTFVKYYLTVICLM